MKKILATATLAFILTGFAATAFASNSDAISDRMQQIAEKRLVEYEKEKAKQRNN